MSLAYSYRNCNDDQYWDTDLNADQIFLYFSDVLKANDENHYLPYLGTKQEFRDDCLLLWDVLDGLAPGQDHVEEEEAHQYYTKHPH